MLNSHIQGLLSGLQRDGHRNLVILSGDSAGVQSEMNTLISLFDKQTLVTLSDDPAFSGAIPLSAFKTLLGRECETLIIDARETFVPDLIGAMSGLLRGGGLMFLLIPEIDTWLNKPDKYLNRLSNQQAEDKGSNYLRRIAGIFQTAPGVHWYDNNGFRSVPAIKINDDSKQEATQQALVEAIVHVVTGHRRRPLVITSDRGRGKSAALGMAAAALLKQGREQIIVTAPSVQSLDSLFKHACLDLGVTQALQGLIETDLGTIRYVPADVLCETLPATDLLLIDEAGAIHAEQLETLTHHYSRICFATTVHGYEGNGRGFAVRFLSRLDELCPGWKQMQLSQPVRWCQNDPLEWTINKALMLNCELNSPAQVRPDDAEYLQLDGAALAANEALLQEIFSLLVIAHYQTRPNDLRFILDHPGVSVHALRNNEKIIAACVTVREGQIDDALAIDIRNGRRRLQGEVLPQIMSQYVGNEAFAARSYARIVRIAVTPTMQKKGLGSELLRRTEKEIKKQGVDFIGVNFGASPGLVEFWLKHQFLPLRLGYHKEGASGEHSLLMLKPLNGHLDEDYQTRFIESIAFSAKNIYSKVNSRLLSLLLKHKVFKGLATLSVTDVSDTSDFIFGQSGFEQAQLGLYHLLLLVIGQNKLEETCELILIQRLLQNRNWSDIAKDCGLSGKKEILSFLRQALQVYLNSENDHQFNSYRNRY